MENGERPENVLPNPTADLHWSAFQGAIQDRFADNASKLPDRICVVETASRTTPQRQFTYQQIHEASNVIAHHLLQNGIERGEVIMIYAYRGLDLCIAILAVLKAGAAFSVVDPAYPPDRQIVYLDVARPRGLIIIEKASKEEGRLSEKVRGWMTENLELRTEVPGLGLLDDGSVLGGGNNGRDVLMDQQSLKKKHPGVVVGPHSTPTLNFTSGTLACFALCSSGKSKHLTFISSTAVLDTDHYVSLTTPILESDFLDGFRKGLSKYVSEYLMREAGRRGLRGSIIRPGYITGNPATGIGLTDDYLLRMLKGSI